MPPTFTDEGMRAALEARRASPGTPVLVLSQYVEESYAAELLADGTGGVGYLLKDRVADVARLRRGGRRVADGGTALDPEVVAQLLGAQRRRRAARASSPPREREVLELMAEGRSNAGIAGRSVVTDGAVEKHVTQLFAKLGLPPADDGPPSRAGRAGLPRELTPDPATNVPSRSGWLDRKIPSGSTCALTARSRSSVAFSKNSPGCGRPSP